MQAGRIQRLEAKRTDLCAMAAVIVSESDGNDALQNEIVDNFQQFYSDFDTASQKKIILFLSVLRILSFLRSFRDWRAMPLNERSRFFESIEYFPVGLIRAGFFGLRSLILLSYYSTTHSWQRIGYEGPLVNRSIYTVGHGVSQ